MLTDSDWATSVDTWCSHGCYEIMFAGAAIAHRSKSHKSVILSSAAAEYYEKTRENGSENRFLSRVKSAAMRECEP